MPQSTREGLLPKEGHARFTERQLQIVIEAAEWLDPARVKGYLTLRQMVARRDPAERMPLELQFMRYYGLEMPRAGEDFRRQLFNTLYTFTGPVTPATYRTLLDILAHAAGTQDTHGPLPASLVSLIVSLCDEGAPIYDRHVSHFFGLVVPATGDRDYRIALYLDHLERINRTYMGWATNPAFCRTTAQLCERIPDLATCHPVRVCHMLIEAAVRRWERLSQVQPVG